MIRGCILRVALTLASALAAVPAIAAHHHGRTSAPHHAAAKHAHKADANPAPKGVVTVPAGGLKIYCAGSRSPLLVRKFTQGSGTTVTVLCR